MLHAFWVVHTQQLKQTTVKNAIKLPKSHRANSATASIHESVLNCNFAVNENFIHIFNIHLRKPLSQLGAWFRNSIATLLHRLRELYSFITRAFFNGEIAPEGSWVYGAFCASQAQKNAERLAAYSRRTQMGPLKSAWSRLCVTNIRVSFNEDRSHLRAPVFMVLCAPRRRGNTQSAWTRIAGAPRREYLVTSGAPGMQTVFTLMSAFRRFFISERSIGGRSLERGAQYRKALFSVFHRYR